MVGLSIVASGLQAMSGKMAAHANNIANSQTPGYRRLVARTIERPEGGVDLSITRDQEPFAEPESVDVQSGDSSETVTAGPFTSQAPTNTYAAEDLIADQVGMMEAQHGMEALVATYQRQEQAMGTLLDVFA